MVLYPYEPEYEIHVGHGVPIHAFGLASEVLLSQHAVAGDK
jgi:hypothetical protein